MRCRNVFESVCVHANGEVVCSIIDSRGDRALASRLPLEEQRAIVAHIAAETIKQEAMRSATERTTALAKEGRVALIAAAVTGQIDVGHEEYYTGDAAGDMEQPRRQ
jgi:hypothetical protein